MSNYLQPKEITMVRKDDRFVDRWIVYADKKIIGSSDNPTEPLGVWSCDEVEDWNQWRRDIGVISSWEELLETLQKHLVYVFSG